MDTMFIVVTYVAGWFVSIWVNLRFMYSIAGGPSDNRDLDVVFASFIALFWPLMIPIMAMITAARLVYARPPRNE